MPSRWGEDYDSARAAAIARTGGTTDPSGLGPYQAMNTIDGVNYYWNTSDYNNYNSEISTLSSGAAPDRMYETAHGVTGNPAYLQAAGDASQAQSHTQTPGYAGGGYQSEFRGLQDFGRTPGNRNASGEVNALMFRNRSAPGTAMPGVSGPTPAGSPVMNAVGRRVNANNNPNRYRYNSGLQQSAEPANQDEALLRRIRGRRTYGQ